MTELYARLHENSALRVPLLPQCNRHEPQRLSRDRRLTPQVFWQPAIGLNQPRPSRLRGHDLKCSEARSAALFGLLVHSNAVASWNLGAKRSLGIVYGRFSEFLPINAPASRDPCPARSDSDRLADFPVVIRRAELNVASTVFLGVS